MSAPDKKLIPFQVAGHTLIVKGQLLRVCQLKQEFYYDVEQPRVLIDGLKKSKVRADILTFLQKFPEKQPAHSYYMEWENFAAIPIQTFDEWHRGLPKATRRGIRKAEEFGIAVRWAEFDERLILGITELFNETPLRQGKPFWHYGKNFAEVKAEMALDLERSRFLGAYLGDELVGFIKFIFGPNYARTTQVISKIAHRNKYPTNALIAKAVQLCAEEKIPYLVYGQFDHGKVGNQTLMEFKANNGFIKMEIPRYFVPLNFKGELGLKAKLHHGAVSLLPKPIIQGLLHTRQKWHSWNSSKSKTSHENV